MEILTDIKDLLDKLGEAQELCIDGNYYDAGEVYDLIVAFASSSYDSGFDAAMEEVKEA